MLFYYYYLCFLNLNIKNYNNKYFANYCYLYDNNFDSQNSVREFTLICSS